MNCAHCSANAHGRLPLCLPCYMSLDIKLRHAFSTASTTALQDALSALKTPAQTPPPVPHEKGTSAA